jgi:protein-S-isoprenylcysteine O-methyltransferase Ste14
MRATRLEFRYRSGIITGIFAAGFACYLFDSRNAAVAVTDWLAGEFGTAPQQNLYRIAFGVAALPLIAAAWIRTWGTSYLRTEVMRDSQIRTERLVADGPYRHVRNPLYIGTTLLAVGLGLMASRAGFLVMALGVAFFAYRLIRREEAELIAAQGEPYRRYCAAVPRLLPSIAARVAPAGNTPAWKDGLRGELFYWLVSATVLVYAVTLNVRLFDGLFIGSFFLHLLMKAAGKRRATGEGLPARP